MSIVDGAHNAIIDGQRIGHFDLLTANVLTSFTLRTTNIHSPVGGPRLYLPVHIEAKEDLQMQAKKITRTITPLTLGAAAVTFAITGEAMIITGDGGGNVIATITGGVTGQKLVLFFVDAQVTISNNDGHGANTIDLVGAADFVSADDSVLILMSDGTSWYEIGRSVN